MAIIAMLNGMTTWYRERAGCRSTRSKTLYVRLVAAAGGRRQKED
jgi:hypothetical protein